MSAPGMVDADELSALRKEYDHKSHIISTSHHALNYIGFWSPRLELGEKKRCKRERIKLIWTRRAMARSTLVLTRQGQQWTGAKVGGCS